MSNNLGLAGATPSKQPKFAPLYTGRWSSGLWTNRSPLRDATTSRIVEKFYGQAGDALIAGLNVEITNKLTLARRPGTSVYDSNSYTGVDRFYEFRLFDQNTETIILMVDQANALYSLSGGVKTDIFDKSIGAGQTYMQSVGNILYFANGIDNKKYMQTLQTWQANFLYGQQTTPFLTTFIVDSNGNIQQLLGTIAPLVSYSIAAPTTTSGPVITLTSSITLSNFFAAGDTVSIDAAPFITYWDSGIIVGQELFANVTVLTVSGTSMTTTWPFPTISPFTLPVTTTATTGNVIAFNGGTPKSGATIPTFSNVQPGVVAIAPNKYKGGWTVDNTVLWVNHGPLVKNWGITNTPTIPISTVFNQNYAGLGSVGTLPFPNWTAGTAYIAGQTVIDSNNNLQQLTFAGTPAGPEPNWSKIIGDTTVDGGNTWTMIYQSALSPSNGGYQYCVALVNSLDDTYSNVSPLSPPTGNFNGAQNVYLAPGMGLPSIVRAPHTIIPGTTLDFQADYVAIFRTTDGQATPFLIPGQDGTTWTMRLSDYLIHGFWDNTQDTGLNNLISAPIAGENTVPATGAINLTYHLNRIWYSIGNVVYWTSGPDAPEGNGLNGSSPLNFDSMPSLVTRLVPTTSGMLVFTVSDVYIIQGLGTQTSPIQGSQPLLPGIGLLSYNALDVNGAIIGLFTTDNQFLILDPSAGTVYAGFPIGDQLRLNNGGLGTSWNPKNAYVAWHVQGEDQAWYVCDGANGWYRLMTTPAPETGYTWSPFAQISGGVKAVQSIEVSPGVHRLLLGPVSTGELLQRDLSVYADNGTPYSAYAVVGSAVLTQPGQVAQVAHIVTDSVRVGSPISLGVLIDEALPYYTGPIDILKNWESDPPNLPTSKSFYSQRFYLSDNENVLATLRHMQIQVIFSPADTVMNELLTMTVFGTYLQEL